MEAKYIPFKKAIAKTLIAGMLFSSVPKISFGEIIARFNADNRQHSVGIEYVLNFGDSESQDKKGTEKYSLEAKADGNKKSISVMYTSNNFTEFLWGLTRPIHPYNISPRGKLQILPFYTSSFRPGGIFSPFIPGAWKKNTALTAGTLASEVAIAIGIYLFNKTNKKESYTLPENKEEDKKEDNDGGDGEEEEEEEDDDKDHGGDPY